MATPTVDDMRTSLEDAQFFYEKINTIVRGPQEGHDLQTVRRYFRAFLHCWKCVPDYVRKLKGLGKNDWIAWITRWQSSWPEYDKNVWDYLRKTRDDDTHVGTIQLAGEVSCGLFPIVMFLPGKQSGPKTELAPCCERGLAVIDRLIREHPGLP